MVLFNHLKTTPSTSVERFLTGEGGRSAQKIPHIVYAERVDSNVAEEYSNELSLYNLLEYSSSYISDA